MNQDPREVLNTEDGDETTPALDLDSILAIHRDGRGYICFGRKPDPTNPPLDKFGNPKVWENLFSIQVNELRTMFPAFVDWLAFDSYFSISQFYRAAPYKNPTTGLPDVWRKEKHLAKLAACYADLDCGRPESIEPGATLTWRQAQHEAERLADNGIIPQPSIMARSGRGVYLIWLLRDEKDLRQLPHAWPEKVTLYKAINRALNEKLRSHLLPADSHAIDAARVLRVPGSIHRGVSRRVTYVIQLDEHGKGFVYTLPQLAATLDLPAPGGELPAATRALAQPPQYRRKVKDPGSAPRRSVGTRKLNALRAADLLTIQTWRGGFLKRGMKYTDGHSSPGRRLMLSIYADFLKGSGAPYGEAFSALRSMALNMTPAYPSDSPDQDPPVQNLLAAVYLSDTRRFWRNSKLCALLGITAEVARQLDLKTIRPRVVAQEADQARPLQADIVEARRAFAREYLRLFHHTTARKLAEAYRHKGFIGANAQTANLDLNAIGYKVTRSTGGRPRKALWTEKTIKKPGKVAK